MLLQLLFYYNYYVIIRDMLLLICYYICYYNRVTFGGSRYDPSSVDGDLLFTPSVATTEYAVRDIRSNPTSTAHNYIGHNYIGHNYISAITISAITISAITR